MENKKKITAEVIWYEDDEYWDDELGDVTVRTYTVVVHDPTEANGKRGPWLVTAFYTPVR